MKKIWLPLLMTLSLQVSADSFSGSPTSRYFKVLPEAQSHTSTGFAKFTSLDPQSIKVLVWNIKKAIIVGWNDEFKKFGDGKDLFLLQESYQNEDYTKTLANFTEIRWDMGISFLYRQYGDTATGAALGSEAQPSEVIVKHSPNREPVTFTPKAMVMGKYVVGNEELLVISVHGINFNSYTAFVNHMEQAVVEIKNHSGPVLFAGDFNTHTNGRVAYLERITKELGFEEVEFKNGQYRTRAPVTKNFFDHAFVRGLKVKSAEVVKDSVASDHRPMVLELSL